MQQLTKEQAIAFFDSRCYEDWEPEQIVRFQLFQQKLCVPFDLFHSSMEEVLGRPVFTHEFAFMSDLIREYLGEKPAPTLDEILDMIPEEKRVVIFANSK